MANVHNQGTVVGPMSCRTQPDQLARESRLSPIFGVYQSLDPLSAQRFPHLQRPPEVCQSKSAETFIPPG
jgi:hypothetical protein